MEPKKLFHSALVRLAPLNKLNYDFSCFTLKRIVWTNALHSFKTERTETKLCNLFYVENAICLFQCISVYFSIVLFVFQLTSFFHVHFFLNPNITTSWRRKKLTKSKMTAICFVSIFFLCFFHSEVRLVDAVFFHCYVCVCLFAQKDFSV